jgi:hypothetical protein
MHDVLPIKDLCSSLDTNICCGHKFALLDIFMSYFCVVQSVGFPTAHASRLELLN